jgi:hypothetical protein
MEVSFTSTHCSASVTVGDSPTSGGDCWITTSYFDIGERFGSPRHGRRPEPESDLTDENGGVEIVVVARRPQKTQPGILERLRRFACSLPSIDVGLGADMYAGLGGSVGGSGKIDIASGQIGIGFNIAAGAGFGVEAGPSVGVSPSGSGIVSANVTASGGGGYGVGTVVTRNVIGTDPGQTGVSVGRVGTPIGFVNGGAAAGFNTPKTNPLGCK